MNFKDGSSVKGESSLLLFLLCYYCLGFKFDSGFRILNFFKFIILHVILSINKKTFQDHDHLNIYDVNRSCTQVI